MKKQLLAIHGGTAWPTHAAYVDYLRTYPLERIVEKMTGERRMWRDGLAAALGPDWDVLLPSMPSSQNAHYNEWVIWLEKLLPLLRDDVVLVGHSLGGVFLAKYLSERALPVRVAQLHLVAAPISDTPDEQLCTFAIADPAALATIADRVGEIVIYHSEDDPVVPFADAAVYLHHLPGAELVRCTDRGHFLQEDFPELVARITGAEH